MHSCCVCLSAFLICYHGRWAHLPTLLYLYPFVVGLQDSALLLEYAWVALTVMWFSWKKALDSDVHVCRAPWS